MRAAVPVADDVGVALNLLTEGVRPLHGQINADLTKLNLALSGDVDDLVVQDLAAVVEPLHELLDAAFVVVVHRVRLFSTLVRELDVKASVEEGRFAEPGVEDVEIELHDVAEDGQIRTEANRRPGALCLARHREGARRLAALIPLLVNRTITLNGHVQPCRDGVHGRNADAVKSTGHLVGGVVEFSTGVELRHDDFRRRDAEFGMLIHRNSAPVILHRHTAVGVHDHVDAIVAVRKMFVHGVVDDFPNAVVQRRPVVWIPKVHSGAHPHRFESFQNLDAVGPVIIAHVPSLRRP